ncbi:MAG: bifunctional protein-serine/threonine kinase/phosphatase [Novosphingobium sp.]|nr:bifunctional protein-serine/threonine kinase/phosphatase [Novosphingobium sp.]
MRSQLAISLGQWSEAGTKAENQDFHGAVQPDGPDLAEKGVVVALADGISTSALGAVAAETAVKTFLADYYCTSAGWSAQTSGTSVISAINSWIYAQNRRATGRVTDENRERGMVCTFSAMVLKSRTAHLFHVGDARIALIGDDAIEPLTEAHRVNLGGGKSYLGRALGVNNSIDIDYRQVPLNAGMTFMLSTDGVHEYLSDADVLAVLAKEPNLNDAAQELAARAMRAGSPDNLTVQLLRVESLPAAGDVSDLMGAEGVLPPAPLLRPAEDFAGYAILRELHSGSRSHVYLARDKASGARVALKVPSTEAADDSHAVNALLLEEWIMRRVDNPHLLAVGPSSGPRRHAFVVSDYVEGQTLYTWMNDNGAASPEETRAMIGQIARGLQALHRREIVHRDLRPHNVLIDAEGTARIIDFGSAQVAGLEELGLSFDDGAFAGTMQYSAPELYLGYQATNASDIYSLGVIAYQMLTGALPYGPRVSAARTAAAQRRLRYIPAAELNPAVPPWMDAALARAVAVDPAKRYGELSEFIYDLSHPNRALFTPEERPLLMRGSVGFWQAVAAALAIALAVSVMTRPQLRTPDHPSPQSSAANKETVR